MGYGDMMANFGGMMGHTTEMDGVMGSTGGMDASGMVVSRTVWDE